MLAWFLRLLGLSQELTDQLVHASFAFQRPAIFWGGLLILIPLGYYIFQRHRHRLIAAPPILHVALSGCRVAILALLVFILAGPYLRIDHTMEKRPIVALLLDESRSMWLPAGPFSKEMTEGLARAAGLVASDQQVDETTREALDQMSRLAVALGALHTHQDLILHQLAERFDLRFFTVGEKLAQMKLGGGSEALPDRKSVV